MHQAGFFLRTALKCASVKEFSQYLWAIQKDGRLKMKNQGFLVSSLLS